MVLHFRRLFPRLWLIEKGGGGFLAELKAKMNEKLGLTWILPFSLSGFIDRVGGLTGCDRGQRPLVGPAGDLRRLLVQIVQFGRQRVQNLLEGIGVRRSRAVDVIEATGSILNPLISVPCREMV